MRALAAMMVTIAVAGGVFASAGPAASVGVPAALPSTEVNYQLDASHDGHGVDPRLVAPLTKAWSVSFPPSSTTYPLIVGDRVFIAFSSGTNGPGTEPVDVEALDLDTGDVVWGPKTLPSQRDLAALAYDRGRLFVTDYAGDLFAFDAETGGADWALTPVAHEYLTDAPPTAYDGTLYFPGADLVYAIDETNGAIKWTAAAKYSTAGSPVVNGTGVYVSASCRDIQRFSFAGKLIWSASPDCPYQADRLNVLHDGVVYAHAGDVAGNRDAYPGPALSQLTGRAVGSFVSGTPPAFESDLMVGVERGRVSASNLQSGVSLWNTPDYDYALPALLVNGYAAVANTAGDVRLLNEQTGRVVWSGSVTGSLAAPDEFNYAVPSGMAEGSGHLAVASSDALTVFASASSPKPRVDITSGPILDTFTRGAATFRFSSDVSDPTYACTLDGKTRPCTSPYSTTGLSQGAHHFRVSLSGDAKVVASRTFDVDRTAPSARVVPLPASTLASKAIVSWSGSDGQSAVRNFDVRVRAVTAHGTVGPWKRPVGLQRDILAAAELPVAPGTSLCVSVRARDLAGNISPWTPQTCTTAAVDDASPSVRASKGWTKYSGGLYFDYTHRQTDMKGATLSLRGIDARKVAIRAVQCPSCGSVTVRFAGHHTTLDLQGGRRRLRTFTVFRSTTNHLGRLRLTVTSAHREVDIDAFRYSRTIR